MGLKCVLRDLLCDLRGKNFQQKTLEAKLSEGFNRIVISYTSTEASIFLK